MGIFTKTMVSALALAFTATALPTTAQARPDYHKRWEKAMKQRRKAIKHYYKHSYRPPRPHYYSPYYRYRDRDRDYENESFRIYSTPYGGLGFSYSKSEGEYGW